MTSTTAYTVASTQAKQNAVFLTIAPEIRNKIYKELFEGATVHMHAEAVPADEENLSNSLYEEETVISANVNFAIVQTCRTTYQEAHTLFYNSIRYSLSHDICLNDVRQGAPTSGFFEKITYLFGGA